MLDVDAASGGWPAPWPNLAELALVLPVDKWTLVGGLMTQLHTVHRRLGLLRPTNHVDIVLHVETSRGVPAATATALEGIGYQLLNSGDPRAKRAHRFVRDRSAIDLVVSGVEATSGAVDTVDVLRSDHAAPAVVERLRGRDMVAIEGGTQALRRTVNARLEIGVGTITTISVPRPFGAVVLKAAAYVSDSRDRDRHLFDAVALLACVEDPLVEREQFAGSDRKRLLRLADALPARHPAWRALPSAARSDAEAALQILTA